MYEDMSSSTNYTQALQDFRKARRQAALQSILSTLTGDSNELLSFEDVKHKLKISGMVETKGIHEIPLDAIIGSVGRYTDFTRTFLPKMDSNEHRWVNIQVATNGLIGLPPISVYKINESYFVKDGNHRVSVARQMGATHIEAYVTDVRTKVPLDNNDDIDDLILKAGYADFLDRTNLSLSRPDTDFMVTAPGKYWILEAQIEAYAFYLSQQEQRDVTFLEAAERWHDDIYKPAIKVIRRNGILRGFPNRTEADLYIWMADHRASLRENVGWEVTPEKAVNDLSAHFGKRLPNLVKRLTSHVLDLVSTEPKAMPDNESKDTYLTRRNPHLFYDILVALTPNDKGWRAVEQALIIAHHEKGRVHGIHITEPDGPDPEILREEFEQRCAIAEVEGELTIREGSVVENIIDRAGWTDVVVVPINHPPSTHILARLGVGFHTLLYRSPRPILAVRKKPTHLKRALLAYDGSYKAKEGLFLATYLASKWNTELIVISVLGERVNPSLQLSFVEGYTATYNIKPFTLERTGDVPTAILETAKEHDCDLIVMGGYGHSQLLDAVIGSSVDEVLRKSRIPVLIFP